MDDTIATFGSWIRRRRKALDLTQDALANLVGCSKDLIVKIEGDARRPSREIAGLLATHLQLAASEHADFIRCARAELAADRLSAPTANLPVPAFPTRAASASPVLHGNLPTQLSSFLGREHELAELQALLIPPDVRLLTLTGPGGTGKTRLALQLAHAMAANYADGAWFVDLAPISDPQQVAATIVQALKLTELSDQTPQERLIGWLRTKQVLLLLDNFEQVLDAAPLVRDLLQAAPELTVLVTSRVPLRLRGEQEYPVAPLRVPEGHPVATQHLASLRGDLTQYEAVRLFIARARAVKPSFQVTNTNAPAVAEICVRLDGLPLAIELAAARIRLFPPETLLARLRQAILPTLVGGARDLPARQQTIQATIDWSYRLLTPAQQRLFARMNVFVGGWTLEAAEFVGAEDGVDIVAELQKLVEHSLVRVSETDTAPRFGMLETLREFALERLAEVGEEPKIRRRHAEYFVELAEAISAQGGEYEHSDERTRTDYANLRAVLAWCRSAGPGGVPEAELGMRLAKALRLYWLNYDLHEGLRWLRELCGPAWRHGPPHLRARLLSSLGRHMVKSISPDDHAQAAAVLEEGVQLSREIGDMWALAEACRHRAQAAKKRNDLEDLAEAEVWLGESLAAGHAAESPWNIAWTQIDFGLIAIVRGDNQEAARLFEACLPVFQSMGVAGGVSATVHIYSVVLLRLGAFARAAQLLDETLDSFRPDLPVFELSQLHDLRGQVAYAQSDLRLAWDLFVQALQFGQEHAQQFLIVEDWVVLKALLGQLAVVAAALGHHVQATHLFCHAHDRLWYPQPNLVQAQIGASLAACRAALGEEAFDAAWAAGQALTLEQAVDEALAFAMPDSMLGGDMG